MGTCHVESNLFLNIHGPVDAGMDSAGFSYGTSSLAGSCACNHRCTCASAYAYSRNEIMYVCMAVWMYVHVCAYACM